MDPETFRQARWEEPTLFDLDEGPAPEGPFDHDANEQAHVPSKHARKSVGVPTVPRSRLTRHLTRQAQMTFGVDTGTYPLGSCTMKYNAKMPELLAHEPDLVNAHPLAREDDAQGILALLFELQGTLAAIGGLPHVSLQPAAGAQGEFVAMRMVRERFRTLGELGEKTRCEVVVPDSAHGTNPASAAMAGFDVLEIPSGSDGCVDVKALEDAVSERTAAFMLTNPNTLGIFERNVEKIAEIVHDAGAKLYYDGANLNAILGKTNPGAMGFDIMHFNVHKTFATPHGGGGPGAGPVACTEELAPYLPVPRVEEAPDGSYALGWGDERAIGAVRGFHGNVGVLVRALAYIRQHGSDGLTRVTETAVANANYLYQRIKEVYPAPGEALKKHEFVVTAEGLLEENGIGATEVGKRLLDYGIHAPTVHFPINVRESLMIEPTETETREELDALVGALLSIGEEDPSTVQEAPFNTAARRVDDVHAARNPLLTWDQVKASDEEDA